MLYCIDSKPEPEWSVSVSYTHLAGVFVWKRYSPSKEQADLNKYYGIKQEGQLAITVNNEVVEPNGRIIDGKAYVQYETVRDHISSRFYWDAKENKLLRCV